MLSLTRNKQTGRTAVSVHSTAEIAVVGAGPAGAIAAARLAQLDHEVVLIEGAHLARPHLCETLTAGAVEQLAFLGFNHAVEQSRLRPSVEVELRWRQSQFETHVLAQPGVLINRTVFDAALVAAASEAGVRVLRTRKAAVAARVSAGWRIRCESGGHDIVHARMIVDASGRRGVLPKKRANSAPRLMAVQACWRGGRLPAHVRVAAGTHAWTWGAPLTAGNYAAAVFLDPRSLKAAGGSLEQRYCRSVLHCGLLEGSGDAVLAGPVTACDATPYFDTQAAGADFFKIGDAALCVDPISSAGVQIAVHTAIAAAAAVHTLLGDPAAAGLVAEFWSTELARRAARHCAWSAQFYREAGARFRSAFWHSRAGAARDDKSTAPVFGGPALPEPHEPLRIAGALRMSHAPCLIGDAVARRRVVVHPSLPDPVAFIADMDLPDLLDRIQSGMTAAAVVQAWSRTLAPDRAMAALSWIWRRGLVEPANARLREQ